MSTTSTSNTYPFKDALFSFISTLNLCIDECALIRKTRHASEKKSPSLKRYLASYSAALSDEYNYHHTGRIGSRIETGDQAAIFDIEKLTSQFRTYVLAPLHEVAVRRSKPDSSFSFSELKDTTIAICDDVFRVIEYLVERLSRKSRPDPTPLLKRERQSQQYQYPPPSPSPSPYYRPHFDPGYDSAPRPSYAPIPESSYYGVRAPVYAAPPRSEPKYVAVRDAYGKVVLVRSHSHRR